jgi:two-component system NarL family sensor kinase
LVEIVIADKSNSPSSTETLEQRNWELSVLNAIAESLNREVDLSQALKSTLSQVVELFNLKTGWIWLMHEEDEEPYLAASLSLPPALEDNPRKMEGWCTCLTSYVEGNLDGAANVNVITCSRLSGLVDGTDGLRYHSSVPLYAPQGKRLGILNVVSGDWRELSEDDLRLLYTIGDLLSIAIERARLFEQSAEYGAAEERNRLAREIHDTLAQGMAAITLQLETAELLMESDQVSPEIRRRVQKSLELAQENLAAARLSVTDLRAAPLAGRNLPQALSELVAEKDVDQNTHIGLAVTGGSHPIPQRLEIGLYRIAQEAINNALVHANARHISLELAIAAQETRMAIKDDGLGFDPANIDEDRFGLTGMNERAKLLGGTLNILTTPGKGTWLEVSVPTNVGRKLN